MQFTCETHYNVKLSVVMAKVLRKTAAKKRNFVLRLYHFLSRLFLWVALVYVARFALLSLLLGYTDGEAYALLMFSLVSMVLLCFENRLIDWLCGWMAFKRLQPGENVVATMFSEDSFVCTVNLGRTERKYESIMLVVEMPDYFVFVYNKRMAQLHEKRFLKGGTVEEFRAFLEEKTGKKVQIVK